MERPEAGPGPEGHASLEALSCAISADAWRQRVGAVEFVRDELRKLPKPQVVERLAGILYQAGCDPKWEVRRAVADSLDLLPEPFAGRLEEKLRSDSHHDVRSAVERLDKRRKRQAREAKKLDNRSAQAAARIARLGRLHGPEVAREAQEAAWELLSAVVRPVVHDLRHVLLDESGTGEPETPDERRRRWRWVVGLAADLTDFSDPAAREPERVVLRDAVEEALEVVRKKVGIRVASRVRHELAIEQGLTVQVPRGRLVGALTNLCKNAFECFEGGDGLVRFGCETTDRRRAAVLRIADDGPGIPRAELERIWLPGVTTKRPRSGPQRHTGWGLAIARRFVERDCRGSIAVESAVGAGTTFVLELPTVRKGVE